MIVGTRLLNGKIAHFKLDVRDYTVARNDVLHEMSTLGEVNLYTPVLVSIPDCGRNLKVSVAAHRAKAGVQVAGRDPLRGALEVINEVEKGMVATEAVESPDEVLE